jgi:hypothetical protein
MSNDEVLAIQYAAIFSVPAGILIAIAIEYLKGRPIRWVAGVGAGTTLLVSAAAIQSWKFIWGFIPLILIAVIFRRFMLLTDIKAGYGYHYKQGWGWMPHFDIRSSPSARKHVLCDVKSLRRRILFGIPYEELTGFDRTLDKTIIEPGTMNHFKESGPVLTTAPALSNPPTSQQMRHLQLAIDGLRLFVRTQAGYEYEASGPGNLRSPWTEKLYRVRSWLDKYGI